LDIKISDEKSISYRLFGGYIFLMSSMVKISLNVRKLYIVTAVATSLIFCSPDIMDTFYISLSEIFLWAMEPSLITVAQQTTVPGDLTPTWSCPEPMSDKS
jgi:hypothetical protein